MIDNPCPPEWNGYHDCPCRDCFEIAIGAHQLEGSTWEPNLCILCEEAGCTGEIDSECCQEPMLDEEEG
jgi:hypothetical protein